jgi:hypothetical protein
MLLLRFKATLFGRAGKSGRPPPLEPSLKVQRDIAHNQSSGFAMGINARWPLKVHPKWRLEESALATHALAPIGWPITACKFRTHQWPTDELR